MTGALAALTVVTAACSSSTETADSGDLVGSTELVCDEFAAHAKAGLPRDHRADVVTSISEIIDNADGGVRDAFPGLRRTVDRSSSAYRLAADVFAQSCFDAGWDG